MNLANSLLSDVILNFSAKDKWEAISKIAIILARNTGIEDTDVLIEALYAREREISTGLEFGIAMPHVKSDLVQSISFGVAVANKGIEFETLDNTLVRIIVLIFCPKKHLEKHMQLMVALSKLLTIERNRTRILEATTVLEIAEIFKDITIS